MNTKMQCPQYKIKEKPNFKYITITPTPPWTDIGWNIDGKKNHILTLFSYLAV